MRGQTCKFNPSISKTPPVYREIPNPRDSQFVPPNHMAAAAVAARSAFRSSSATVRTAASRISAAAKSNATSAPPRSAFRFPSQKPLSHRIFRSPVEMSCMSVESLFPFHTATASALLTSMLSAAPRTCGWTLEDMFS
ncbi:hypothetical protein OSB04_008328 [Centaurea solstitialis]|uniref:Protein NUCLEAR FUSION DEFECTIVE 6, chloroplastic/mitochondrial-like n=1 Tax=Centaurea solstitialis TaxID=347529 RepID=A0AA38U635_9ASTR|nr:hypothetical protein OSB04_008328 [Centaurea solstitialis]